jgi:hypothetical protein
MTPGDCREVMDDLKARKTGRTFDELRRILESAGGRMHARSGGSHRVFSKPGCAQAPTLKETRGEVLQAYVWAVIRALEEWCEDE